MYPVYATADPSARSAPSGSMLWQAAEEHECGARCHGPERERAAGAPAFATQRHGAEHDERRVGEQEQVDQAGVEPGQRRGEKPGVCAHRHAEQESSQGLPPIGSPRADDAHEQPEDPRRDEEASGKHRADRGAPVKRKLRQDSQPGVEDRGGECETEPRGHGADPP